MAQQNQNQQDLREILQIRRDKLMGERFTRFLKAVNAAGNGVEMNKFYLDQLSTHPDLASPNVLDVLRELSEVATLAVVTNGFDRVQSRRVRESGILDFVEDVRSSRQTSACCAPSGRTANICPTQVSSSPCVPGVPTRPPSSPGPSASISGSRRPRPSSFCIRSSARAPISWPR